MISDGKHCGRLTLGSAALLCFLAVAAAILLPLSCKGDTDRSEDEASASREDKSDLVDLAESCFSADGTMYRCALRGDLFWFVDGRAVKVEVADRLRAFTMTSDRRGGIYIDGRKHVWYVRNGKASPVAIIKREQLGARKAEITTETITWSVLKNDRRKLENHDHVDPFAGAFDE